MRNKVFSITPWIVGCAILVLPVAAQDSGSPGGIFHELYAAIAVWLGVTGDDPELAPMIPPAGQPQSESELGPYTMPGGLWVPGAPDETSPYPTPGGSLPSGDSPELTPYVMPGG